MTVHEQEHLPVVGDDATSAAAAAIPAERLAELQHVAPEPVPGPDLLRQFGGYAATDEAVEIGLSTLAQPAFAHFSYWEPGERLAMPADMCQRFRALTDRPRMDGTDRGGADYFDVLPEDVEPADLDFLLDIAAAANFLWWRLDVRIHGLGLKRYPVDAEHDEHTDLEPRQIDRKFAFLVQLSEPDEYDAGGLWVRVCGHEFPVSDKLGATVAFPSWVHHRVSPVERGERWSLVVSGHGPAFR